MRWCETIDKLAASHHSSNTENVRPCSSGVARATSLPLWFSLLGLGLASIVLFGCQGDAEPTETSAGTPSEAVILEAESSAEVRAAEIISTFDGQAVDAGTVLTDPIRGVVRRRPVGPAGPTSLSAAARQALRVGIEECGVASDPAGVPFVGDPVVEFRGGEGGGGDAEVFGGVGDGHLAHMRSWAIVASSRSMAAK